MNHKAPDESSKSIIKVIAKHIPGVPKDQLALMATEICTALHGTFKTGTRCPICSQKRRVLSKESKDRLKSLSTLPRRPRSAPYTVSVLKTLQRMPVEFETTDLLAQCKDVGEKTVRKVITTLHKSGEISGPTPGQWRKTGDFGKSKLWDKTGPRMLF